MSVGTAPERSLTSHMGLQPDRYSGCGGSRCLIMLEVRSPPHSVAEFTRCAHRTHDSRGRGGSGMWGEVSSSVTLKECALLLKVPEEKKKRCSRQEP